MRRRAGWGAGVAVALIAGASASACDRGDARPSGSASAVQEVARTTQATQPVVTVYKSPT